MPRKAPRKPPVGSDLMPVPPKPRGYAKPARNAKLKPMTTVPSGTKKQMGTKKVAKRTAPRPTKGYR